jgi:hypothetical protein
VLGVDAAEGSSAADAQERVDFGPTGPCGGRATVETLRTVLATERRTSQNAHSRNLVRGRRGSEACEENPATTYCLGQLVI